MWWTLGEHASPCENGDVIGVPLGQREVMDRHDDGLVEVTDECEQVMLLGQVQVVGRFIQHEYGSALGQPTGQHDSTALSTGQS